MDVNEADQSFSRRRHVRLKLPVGQQAGIRIIAIGHSDLTSPSGRVQLLNVSEGGCCFYSELRFPTHPQVLMELSWKFGERPITVAGRVVWRLPADGGGYRHGMQFVLSPLQRTHLIGQLNVLLLHLCPGQARIHALYRKMTSVPYPIKSEEAPS